MVLVILIWYAKKLIGINPIFRDIPVNNFFKIISKAHFRELKDRFSIPKLLMIKNIY